MHNHCGRQTETDHKQKTENPSNFRRSIMLDVSSRYFGESVHAAPLLVLRAKAIEN